MKVLMFGWEYPPFNSGGLGVACLGLTRALSKEGVEVTFVLPRTFPINSPWCTIISAGLEKGGAQQGMQRLSAYSSIAESKRGALAGSGGLFDEVYRYAAAARKIAREVPHDVIHAHDWLTYLAGLAAKEVSGKPLIVHMHATEFDRTGNGRVNQTVYDIERLGMERADKVIAVSRYTKNIIVSRYGIPAEKVEVVHNGVDQDIAPSSPHARLHGLKAAGNHIVLFVGRFTLQKGPDYFLRAAKRVLEYMPNVYFVMAGSGDMERQIIEEAVALGISRQIIFTGFVRDEQLQELYRAADLLVMPSVSEPFGIVPLEAVLNDTPVIISKQSGVAEVLRHALKVDFWDTEETANKILGVLSHASLRQCLRSHAKMDAAQCLWEYAARACHALYRRLIAIFHT